MKSLTKFCVSVVSAALTVTALAVLLAILTSGAMAQSSINARPQNTGNDFFNAGHADAVFGGKHSLSVPKGLVLGPDFSNLLAGQDSIANDAAPFAVHIINVVLMSAEKEVVRANARRIVAFVANDHSFRNLTVSQDHRKDMSAFPEVGPISKYTVPVGTAVSGPQPARVVLSANDFGPEGIFNAQQPSLIRAESAAILNASSVIGAQVGKENLLTSLTGGGDSGFMVQGHFKSPKFDLARDTGARQRSGISLKTKPLYNKTLRTSSKNIIEQSQACSLRVMGAIANCAGSSVLWTTTTPTTSIDHYRLETYAGVYTLGPDKRAFLIPSGCSSGGAVRVIEVRTNGTTCTLDFSGNLPHARSCSDPACSNSAASGATTVHAANFRMGLAPGCIASVFPDAGATFTDQSAQATDIDSTTPGVQLPTVLAGVTITMNGQPCELLSVSPGQINFHIPADADPGPTDIPLQILTTRGSAPQFNSRAQMNPSAPGIFTLASNGTGPAASNWLVVKPNGLQIWQSPGALSYNAADRVYLVLYGTGINETQSSLAINGLTVTAFYTGPSWMVGVNQLVYPFTQAQLAALPSLSGAVVTVGIPGRSFQTQGFDVRK